jgi:hypothetical protein
MRASCADTVVNAWREHTILDVPEAGRVIIKCFQGQGHPCHAPARQVDHGLDVVAVYNGTQDASDVCCVLDSGSLHPQALFRSCHCATSMGMGI